jgi:hypothetical protein
VPQQVPRDFPCLSRVPLVQRPWSQQQRQRVAEAWCENNQRLVAASTRERERVERAWEIDDIIRRGRCPHRLGGEHALLPANHLIRPLVELDRVREVARWNQIATEGRTLHHHLGAQRSGFPGRLRLVRPGAVRGIADRPLHPMVAVSKRRDENLVLCDRRCNVAG